MCSLRHCPKKSAALASCVQLGVGNAAALTALPAGIGGLRSLETLVARGTGFTTLPPEIGRLGALIDMILIKSKLTTLPDEIGDLASLQQAHPRP